MSTFCGRMKEYRFISLDRFDAENLHSAVFFLSHVHRDHTQGLNEDRFYQKLKRNSAIKVYCSKLTRDLLLADSTYSRLREHMIGLEVYEPYSIKVPESMQVITVTLLQSGHCPGSVMFLIEGNEGTVLYTGDFRFEKDGIRSLPFLNSANRPKPLKSLYIDTTFWIPEAYFIPTREDSCEAMVTLAREWVSRSRQHFLVIKHKADLGYEYLLRHLSEELGMKIHVSNARYKTFGMIADMTDFVTTDPHETQLHACRWLMGAGEPSALPCSHELRDAKNISVRTVVLSTMWFVRTVHPTNWVQRMNDSCYRLCYSFHSSYSEIRDIITYLRPQCVYPNVIPSYPRRMSLKEVQQQLDQLLNTLVAKATGRLLTPKKLKASASVPVLVRKRKVEPSLLDEFDFGDNALDFLSPKAKVLRTPIKHRRPSSVSSSPEFKLLLGSPSRVSYEGDENRDDNSNVCSAGLDDLSNSQKSSLGARLPVTDDEDDDDFQSWMTADDVALLANFRPLNEGKFSKHIAYISSSDSDTDNEGSAVCKRVDDDIQCISSDDSVIVIDDNPCSSTAWRDEQKPNLISATFVE